MSKIFAKNLNSTSRAGQDSYGEAITGRDHVDRRGLDVNVLDSGYFNTALGILNGRKIVGLYGYVEGLANSTTPADIWDGGGTYSGQVAHSAQARQLNIVSNNAADIATGTGAREIGVYGLDSDWRETTEFFDLNGTNNVVSTTTWRRVLGAHVVTAGSGGKNAGTITITYNTMPSTVFAKMMPGNNQAQMGVFTVPNGKRAILLSLKVNLSRATNQSNDTTHGLFTLKTRAENGVYRTVIKENLNESRSTKIETLNSLVLNQKTDIKTTIEGVNTSNSVASVAYELFLIDYNSITALS